MIIIKFNKIINSNQSPLLKILYKKYINPLKDVKHEKKPLNKIFLFKLLNFLLIKKPKKKDPTIEVMTLLFINILKTVPKQEAKRI